MHPEEEDEDTEDFYDVEIIEEHKENDSISNAEEGFMIGYLS